MRIDINFQPQQQIAQTTSQPTGKYSKHILPSASKIQGLGVVSSLIGGEDCNYSRRGPQAEGAKRLWSFNL